MARKGIYIREEIGFEPEVPIIKKKKAGEEDEKNTKKQKSKNKKN